MQPVDHPWVACGTPDPQARRAPRLGKGPHHNRVRIAQGERCKIVLGVGEIDIGLIEQDQGAGQPIEELRKGLPRYHRAGRVRRTDDRNEGGCVTDQPAHLVHRPVSTPPRNIDHLGSREDRKPSDHVVGRGRQHSPPTRASHRTDNALESVVGAVGHHDALRLDAEPRCDGLFERPFVRIPVDRRTVDGLSDRGRRGQALVEIEDEIGTARAIDLVRRQPGNNWNRFDKQRTIGHESLHPHHATIWARRVTTISVPPAALIRGITDGSSARGTAALTA